MFLAAISRGDPSTTDNNVISIYSADTLALEFQRLGHTNHVTCLCFSSDGTRLISAGRDRTVRVWCLYARSELLKLSVTSVVDSLSVYSEQLLTMDCHGRIFTWDLTTGSCVLTLFIGRRFGVAACFSADGSMIVSGNAAGSSTYLLSAWDAQSGENKPLGSDAARPFLSLAVSPCPCMISASGMAATGYKDGAVCLWNLSSKSLQASVVPYDSGAVTAIAFNSDGMRLATGSRSGKVNVWDTSDSTLLHLKGLMVADYAPMLTLSFDTMSRRLACSTTYYTWVNLASFARDEVFICDLEAEDGDITPSTPQLTKCCYATFSPASVVMMCNRTEIDVNQQCFLCTYVCFFHVDRTNSDTENLILTLHNEEHTRMDNLLNNMLERLKIIQTKRFIRTLRKTICLSSHLHGL
jgi:WD40 repeat protein